MDRLSEEEKKAIEFLENFLREEMLPNNLYNSIRDVLNLIDKQQVEMNKEKEKNKELEEYQHKVNEILNVDTDNLDTILIKNNQEGLKKCVTEFEKENQSYRDYFGTPPCYDNADYIPKSKVRELQKKYDKEIIKLEHKKIWNESVDTIKKNRYTNYYNAYEELLQ